MDSSQVDLGVRKVHTNSTFNHISKRQKLGTEVDDEPTVVFLAVVYDGTDAEDSDEAQEEAERRDEAMRCECVSCWEPHPDPEQLFEDNWLHVLRHTERAVDLPSARDTNGWRVISDDWSRGICPDCKHDVLGSEASSTEEEESTEDEDEDEDEDGTRKRGRMRRRMHKMRAKRCPRSTRPGAAASTASSCSARTLRPQLWASALQ